MEDGKLIKGGVIMHGKKGKEWKQEIGIKH